MPEAQRLRIRGVVQGVGFRPFVYRLARAHDLHCWVLNGENGVEIHAEGEPPALERFALELQTQAPPAARISSLEVHPTQALGLDGFVIRESTRTDRPTVRISPDLPICNDCLAELFDPADPRYEYPYINCTNCGPRYSIILALPYDRPETTMNVWPMCPRCEGEYHDPANRRFHAQPVACPKCGPTYFLHGAGDPLRGRDAIARTSALLREGAIVAVKGIGGYHLACDARNRDAVRALRDRKFRKERPFALMVRDITIAQSLVELGSGVRSLLESVQRPIVLARAKSELEDVAPGNRELGVMLPYAPLHHLLFACDAPPVLVMTSANRSSEPIAFDDADALERLHGIADAFLIGEREIARRVDDSIARVGPKGPAVLRHARGYAPQAVATLPTGRPMLCVGADLKNAITLVVEGQAFASQHIGDLDHYAAAESFKAAIRDLCAMYDVHLEEAAIVHDAHPEYSSTQYALSLRGEHVAVQHHRAHIASALAERGAFDTHVTGVAFDGTGYGDDGTIWGGEFFTGSIREGLKRVCSLRPAQLPGGDAAARYPVQAAAGFLAQLSGETDFAAAPFDFPARYGHAVKLVRSNVRTFATTSMGRLFDTVAALLGFTREITFEAQAAMWLEQLAQACEPVAAYPFPMYDGTLDYRPLLSAVVRDRLRGCDVSQIARAFHCAVANGITEVCTMLGNRQVVASGGVFQNALLVDMLAERFGSRLWINQTVPCNDGGISLGQAGIAACGRRA
ncbi:MAG: carbamoyltransferase HypF [Vulcanimicrobiaceae bacterium]